MIKKYALSLLSFLLILSNFGQTPALHFDGVNDYVQTSFPAITGNANRTIEAWIKTTANCNPSAGGSQIVIADMGTFVTGGRFTFNVLWSNAIRLEVGGNGLSGSIAVNDGMWHHVAVSYNSSLATNQYKLYVDGVLDVEGNLTVTTNIGSSTNLRIGQRVDGVNEFEGSIDELRVFNTARTLSEIQADMNGEICNSPANLVAYYKLNEGTINGANTANTSAFDYSGNNNDGVLNGFSLAGTTSNWTNGPTLNPRTTYSTFNVNNCAAYTSPSGNYTWTTSGTFMDTLANNSGCDSIMTINLTIGNATSSITSADCFSFTAPSGMVYTTSGVYQDTLTGGSAGGCDSIITLNLTIGTSTFAMTTASCGAYTSPFGEIITVSGTYIDTLSNGSATGCDSVITNMVSINQATTSMANFHTCQDSITVSGVWYSTDQTFVTNHTNAANCDSTHTLNLIFSADVNDSVFVSACGFYTSPQGQTFTTSNIFYEQYTAANTCDSIVKYILTIHQPDNTTSQITACDSIEIDGIWYYDDATIDYSGTNIHTCDSAHTTNLTVVNIDNTITKEANETLKAVEIVGATYAWYNCDNNELLTGENSHLFSTTSVGSYKVEITSQTCSKFSLCENVYGGQSVHHIYNSTEIELTPNPNNGSFRISISDESEIVSYEIVNILGEIVLFETNKNENSITINHALTTGVYFVKINANEKNYMKQLVVR